MENGKIILTSKRFHLTIDRLCHQLLEEYGNFEDACIIGVQYRGVLFADRIHQRLQEILPKSKKIAYGRLDITFYRDDYRIRDEPLKANTTELDFLVEGKRVVLIDDVLYSGRTVQAGLTALQHYGRPKQVELLVLVDRRFNRHLPIQADYVGMTIDAIDEAYVKVEWGKEKTEDKVILYAQKQ